MPKSKTCEAIQLVSELVKVLEGCYADEGGDVTKDSLYIRAKAFLKEVKGKCPLRSTEQD